MYRPNTIRQAESCSNNGRNISTPYNKLNDMDEKMDAADKAMYAHFYNKDQKCFVWSKQNCCFCGRVLYNSMESHCKICSLPPAPKEQYQYTGGYYDDNDRILRRQHLKWLYDF